MGRATVTLLSSHTEPVDYDVPSITTASRTRGLPAEGDQTPLEVVRRGNAVSLHIFSGISALPTDELDQPDSPELRAPFRARAAMAAYSRDLLESTEPIV